MKLTLPGIAFYLVAVLSAFVYQANGTTTAPVSLQTTEAPASFSSTIGTNPASLHFPSFFQGWVLPNGNGTIDCTVLTSQNIAPWDQTNVTFCLLGDGALDYSNSIAFIFGAAGGTPIVGNSRTYVYAGTPPAKQTASWNLGGTGPIIDNRADDGKAIVKVDMRFEVSYENKHIVVKIKDHGADANTFKTIATYTDYLLLNNKNPSAFSNLKVNKNIYFSFGSLYTPSTISNVVVNSLPTEADAPADFSQKIAALDCLALSTDTTGKLAAYSIATNGISLAVMDQAKAVSLNVIELLNTWQPLIMQGLPSSATNQIECFAINGTKQCFITLADGTIFQTGSLLTNPVTCSAFGVNKGTPITITSGQKDVLLVLDQQNVLWHQTPKAGTPVTYNAVQEGPKDATGKHILLANISQAHDGSIWAIDTAGTVWCAKASNTLPLTWSKCAANTVIVDGTLMSLACKSICGISATNALAVTMQGHVAQYSNAKWALLLTSENTPVARFSDVIGDTANNIALFDNSAFPALYTNFPRPAGAPSGSFSTAAATSVSASSSPKTPDTKAASSPAKAGALTQAQVKTWQAYKKASRTEKKKLAATLMTAFEVKTVDEAIKIAKAPRKAIVQNKAILQDALKKAAAIGPKKKQRRLKSKK